MVKKTQKSPWKPEIKKLEKRINELAKLCSTLHGENRELRGKVQDLIAERDLLKEKNQHAVKSIQSVLSSVRILEKQS